MLRKLLWGNIISNVIIDTTQPGSPKITKDSSGNITNYEYTSTPVTFSGEGENTEFVPFTGNFKIHLKCTLGTNTNSYQNTLLHALGAKSSGSGWEGFIIRTQGNFSWSSNQPWALIIGSSKYSLSNKVSDGDTVTFDITYQDGTLTLYINESKFKSYSLNLNSETIQLWIGSDSGGNKSANATIHEFSVTRIE